LKKNIAHIALIIIVGVFTSCSIGFDKAETPFYIYFDNVELKTKLQTEGAPSHKISELWVYADGKFLGAFSKGNPIPIISDNDNIEVNVIAGIRANGSKNDFQQYFPLQSIKYILKHIPGAIDTLDAVFSFADNTQFVFIEDFENGNIFTFDIDTNPATSITISKTDPFSGQNCGYISLDKTNSIIEVTSSTEFFQLPTSGKTVFLEVDYKCNTPFVIGLTGKDIKTDKEYSSDIILLTEKENWNKLYLNLTSTIQQSGLGLYKINFRAEHADEKEKSEISLDNIKMLYLK
jgi:hypothetical protein